MRNAGYFRTPTVNRDTVVFVCEDDLWTVSLAGGLARRLTAGLGPVARPALSRDGELVAFTSQEEHHPEVYVMPAAGGQARRVTYLGANSMVTGWTPVGEIVFRSDAGQPFAVRRLELHAVSPDGGQPRALGYGWANDIAYGPGGGVVLGRMTLDPATWKRYRGGRAGDLWVDARGTGTFKRLISLPGNLANPMWIGARIFFLSDHEGIGNIYSCTPGGKDLRRHTDHGEYYARAASTDGTHVVYAHAAELWSLNIATDTAHRIEVEFPSPRTQRNRKFVEAEAFLQGSTVHPDGHALALDARGKLFTMPLWDGPVREYGAAAGVHYRLGQWLADRARIAVISDGGGEEALEIHKPGAAKRVRLGDLDIGRATSMLADPKQNLVAIANHRLELIVVDADKKTARTIDRSDHAQFADLAWSPDGAWLAYRSAETSRTRSIKLCELATGKTTVVTSPEFQDYSPSFDPEGKYLYFLSFRTFDPVYDAFFFDLGFPRGSKPYAMALRNDVPNPFVPEPKGFGNGSKDEKKKKDEKEAPVRIDLDGIGERIVAFPLPEARYGRIAGIKGKALFTRFDVQGSLGDESAAEEGARGTLEVYRFEEQKHEVIVGGVSDFSVARDGVTLVYRAGHRLRAIKAGERPDEKLEKDPPSRASGWIDLGRARVSVDPAAEWRQMYREAWRLQRDNFWTPDMSGVDWAHVYERYRPLVEKIATRAEFSDLMWEMQGELGTSHAYEMGGDYRRPPAYAMGYMGADFGFDGKTGRYSIAHIVRGDPWDATRTSPLAGVGVNANEGDVLLAINGRAPSGDVTPQSLLVNQAGQMVELTLGDRAGKQPRTVVVKTLRDETPARYREWVELNRAHVHTATKGRVGYVHIPNMGPLGYSEFHRYYLSELEYEGLVVDVRFNGGGHVSQIILEKLARTRIGYDVKRWGRPEPYPVDSVIGPMVCLTNESAGSDGDIFTHCFKLMKLGPVVGKRTWGGVIGIWPRHALVDGGYTTQPEFSFWFSDVGWGVENYGTDPDHVVDIAPQDYKAGRDPQMDKGLDLIARALKRNPPKVPRFTGRPSRKLPKLPPR